MSEEELKLWSEAMTGRIRTSAIPLDDSTGQARRVTLVFYFPDGSQTANLTPEAPIVVGRSEPSDVVIPDQSLSRQHAVFTCTEQEIWLEDLKSTNGTRVNGKAVSRSKLSPDDEVRLGAITAYVHVARPRGDQQLGLIGHDRFVLLLEDEVIRARTFSRTLALVMIRATKAGESLRAHQRGIREKLRPVDRLAMYAPDTLEILLPEVGLDRAEEIVKELLDEKSTPASPWVAGVACFGLRSASADELLARARSAAQRATADAAIVFASGEESELRASPEPDLVISSPAMRALFATVQRLANASVPVLIYGETGVGKEVIARKLHDAGPRKSKPLRSTNCGAIPPTLIESVLFGHEKGAFTGAERRAAGIFEQADGGTVFLDEIGELSNAAQAALLRVLETKRVSRIGSSDEIEVDVRIVAATNKNLERMANEGRFRWDLLYRLNTMLLDVPPLRERSDEIEPLANLFRKQANRANRTNVLTIDDAALVLLKNYAWPGNVRELKNVIERAVVIAEDRTISVEHLSDRIREAASSTAPTPPEVADEADATLDFRARVRRYETELILHAMVKCRWNQTEAAKYLKMPLRTLTHKLRAYQLRDKKKE